MTNEQPEERNEPSEEGRGVRFLLYYWSLPSEEMEEWDRKIEGSIKEATEVLEGIAARFIRDGIEVPEDLKKYIR